MKARRIALVAALIVVAGAALWWFLPRVESASTADAPPPPASERTAQLERNLRAVADGERDAPRDRWDPAYVAKHVGHDADSLLAWVRTNTRWVPYRGLLRGAVGVLMDRQGNTLDRAVLLASLLQHAGYETRLAGGQLPAASVAAQLPALLRATSRQFDKPADSSDGWMLQAAAKEYGLHSGSLNDVLAVQAAAMDSVMQLVHTRVASQTSQLLPRLTRTHDEADSIVRADWAAESLREHWWVQVKEGDAWRDLELLDVASPSAERFEAVQSLPDDLFHTLTVRVVSEQQQEHTRELVPAALTQSVRPSDVSGRTLALHIWPARLPKELHSDPESELGLRKQALGQSEWIVSLSVADSIVASGTLGAAPKVGGRKAVAPSGNPMGGLGGAMAVMGATDTLTTELTAAWIEYEVRAPGRPIRTWRRAVFDLVGPAGRTGSVVSPIAISEAQRLQRGLALMMQIEILPVTSAIAPEFGLHLVAQSTLANAGLLRALAAADSGAVPDRDSLIALSAPGVSPLYALALARLDWSRVGRWLYVDQIGLLTRHRHLGPAGNMVTVRGAVEIIARDLGVAPGGPDPFTVRLEQGVFDTNAEAVWWGGEGINNTADAFESGGDWALLASTDPSAVERLAVPEDARARMREDLAAGFTLVAPAQPVSRGGDHFTGWWRIDPVTGAASGTPANGWAQCGSEYSVHLTVAAEMGKAMLTEFMFCHALAQAANEFKAFVKSFGHLLYAGPIEVLRPRDVAASVNQGCIKGAIVAGMFATLPFLIIQSHRYAEFGLVRMAAPQGPKPFLYQGPNNTIRIPRPGLPTGPYQPAGFAATEPGLPPMGRGPAAPGNPGPPAPPRSGPSAPGSRTGPPAPGSRTGPQAPGSRTGPPAPGSRTGPPAPPGTPSPGGSKYPPTEAGVSQAQRAYQEAGMRERDAWNDLMAYRDQYPVNGRWGWKYDHPGFDAAQDGRLVDAMWKAHWEREQAYADLNEAAAARRNAPVPASPSPAPGRIAAGASLSPESFWDKPWD